MAFKEILIIKAQQSRRKARLRQVRGIKALKVWIHNSWEAQQHQDGKLPLLVLERENWKGWSGNQSGSSGVLYRGRVIKNRCCKWILHKESSSSGERWTMVTVSLKEILVFLSNCFPDSLGWPHCVKVHLQRPIMPNYHPLEDLSSLVESSWPRRSSWYGEPRTSPAGENLFWSCIIYVL